MNIMGEFRLNIGCHLSSSKGYLNMGVTAEGVGANSFAFFTRNPRGGKAKDIDSEDAAAFRDYAEERGFVQLVAHVPYTLNAAAADERVADFARQTFADDPHRMEATSGQLYNFHPGSHVGQGPKVGIRKIADTLNAVLMPDQTTTVLLETMVGKGTEIGRSFEELAGILERVYLSEKVGVCLDACHVWDAGYNIADDLDGVLEEFDRVVGFSKLRAIRTMAAEASQQLEDAGVGRPTHVLVQAGVGSLASAVLGYFANRYPDNPPVFVIMEAGATGCLYQGVLASDGAPRIVGGDLQTIMAGLACGEPNTIGWDILRNHADAFISCPDWVAAKGMRLLAAPVKGDAQVVSGESGAVGMGEVSSIMEDDAYAELRAKLGLDAASQVLLFSTEGDTDPVRYQEIVWDGAYLSI